MPVSTYGLREVADLTFYDLRNEKPFLYIPYALTSSNEHTSQVTYARGGKNNPKRLAFEGNRESTLKISTQLFDFRIISMLAGAQVTGGQTNIFKREELEVTDNGSTKEITLANAPLLGSVTVFPKTEDAVSGQECTITVTDQAVAISNPALQSGDKVVAYYQFQSENTAERICFKTDSFPTTCKVIGDTLIKNEATGSNEPFQMVVYKAKPQANFTLTMAAEGDPTKLEMTFDVLADDQNNFIDYIKY